MPVIKIQHVYSVNSEDPKCPADNLLSSETYRKWKCAAAGEKKAVVVLQLDKSTQIHSIDIGNEGSAFVEVLLGRSSDPESFEVLLGMSTFMTPPESKQWTNTNRVRMFGKEKFAKVMYEQKWDRVKIVCTQPYNKKEQYGLSFVKLHSPPSTDEPSSEEPSKMPTKLGAFSLKEETKDIPAGTFFKKKEASTSSSASGCMSMAAQARAATSEALKGVQSDSPSRKMAQAGPSRGKDSTPKTTESARSTSKKKDTGSKRTADSATKSPPVKKAKVSDDATGKTVPFNEIMAGVVFTLSGFKNPFRGTLRGKATDMGAKFQPDWTPACTHLVCAFSNTPKFNQVKGKGGLIVSKEWITDSHVKKRRLPARKYRLSGGGDSEAEEYDRKEETIFGGTGSSKPDTTTNTDEPMDVVEDNDNLKPSTEDDLYGGSTDEDSDTEVKLKPIPSNESPDRDTDEEIERAKEKELQKNNAEDLYGGSTDEEDSAPTCRGGGPLSLSDLPNLFSKCTFLLYGSLSPPDRRLITRYITAYNGHIEEYMSDKVTHVISLEDWDSEFDKALSENSRLAFVKPQWIFVCHQKQTCVPYQPYIIVPK